MFREDMLYISYCKYYNFKGDFLNISIVLHPQIPDFQIVLSRPDIVLC